MFRLDYCGKDASSSGGPCMMKGYLDSADAGVTYFEDESQPGHARTTALSLAASGTSSGSGRVQSAENGQSQGFSFGYNTSLFRRSDGTNDQCFSRDATDPGTGFSVWRYGLYDATSGARVDRSSGFPIEFTANGATYHGFLGYFGLSLPSDAMSVLTNGATVDKVDYGNGTSTRTSYTIVKSSGKLTRYTKKTTTLKSLDHIRVNTWFGSDAGSAFAGAEPNSQYQVYWDDAGGTFKVAAKIDCSGGNGCQPVSLSPEPTVAVTYWATRGGLNGRAESLGGEVFVALAGVSGPVDSAAIDVVYRVQDLVYPSDLPATLYCVNNCPTAASLGAYFAPGSAAESPFAGGTFNNWNPLPAAAVVSYASSATDAVLKDAAGQAVVFTDRNALQARPNFQGGVRSGRLFVNLADAECASGSGTYCDWKVGSADVYYGWETGANAFNQFAAAKDPAGAYLKFDAPLQLTYTVPAGAQYGEYAGKTLVLQYAGFGNLWGVPGRCYSQLDNSPVSCDQQGARYVSAFAIPFDETSGVATASGGSYLVKWLDREIRFARKDLSVCTAASLQLPGSSVQLPTAAGLKDPTDPASPIYIGAKPDVGGAPRVIQGEVKY